VDKRLGKTGVGGAKSPAQKAKKNGYIQLRKRDGERGIGGESRALNGDSADLTIKAGHQGTASLNCQIQEIGWLGGCPSNRAYCFGNKCWRVNLTRGFSFK
jgi:hypothetical protein